MSIDKTVKLLLLSAGPDSYVTTRNVIKVKNVIKCYISCPNVCDEKCNKIR